MKLETAEKMVGAAMKKAEELAIPSVIAVVDEGGNLKVLKRMDEAIFGSVDIAINKAYTAAAANADTEELGKLAQPGQPLYGLQTANQCRYVLFGGGKVLHDADGHLAGAIGVSGGTVEQDLAVSQAGADAFEK